MNADYVLKDGVLKVNKEMDFDYDVGFDRACSILVDSPESNLVIDLSGVHRITSTYIGLMAATFFQAQCRGKTISIAAHGKVLHTLRLAGFSNFIKLTDSGRLKISKPAEHV